MTRISDLGFQQLLFAGFQRAQNTAQMTQIQLASGKVSGDYSGLGPASARLISAESVVARSQAYLDAASVAQTRLQNQQTSIESIADGVAGLRADFVTALSTGAAERLEPALETGAQRILAALNARAGETYIFGGSDGSAPPVDAKTLADIGEAADPDDLFDPAATRMRLAVEEGTTIDGGPLAQEIAGELMAELHELANAQSVLGPFSGDLTAAQQDFISDKVARFDALSADLNAALGLNGVAQSAADAAATRNTDRRDLAEIMAAGIEDIDVAETIVRFNQDQLAVQASGRALAQATQLSLLSFL